VARSLGQGPANAVVVVCRLVWPESPDLPQLSTMCGETDTVPLVSVLIASDVSSTCDFPLKASDFY